MYICVDRTDNLTILNLHFIAQSAESPLQGRNVQNIICHSFIFWPRVATSIFSDFKQSWDEEVQSKLFIKTFEKQMAPKLNIKNILYNINSVLFILPEKGNWYNNAAGHIEAQEASLLPCLLLVSCFSRDNEHSAVGGTLGPQEGDGEGPEHAGPARGIYSTLYMSTIKCFTL